MPGGGVRARAEGETPGGRGVGGPGSTWRADIRRPVWTGSEARIGRARRGGAGGRTEVQGREGGRQLSHVTAATMTGMRARAPPAPDSGHPLTEAKDGGPLEVQRRPAQAQVDPRPESADQRCCFPGHPARPDATQPHVPRGPTSPGRSRACTAEA